MRREARRRRAAELWLLHAFSVHAPRIFGIETREMRAELAEFFAVLRELAPSRVRIRIDFSTTALMSAAGTLLFAAQLDRINQMERPRRITCNYPGNDVVAQVLQHVGIFDMLKQKRRCRITAANVRHWQVYSGEMADGQMATRAMSRYRKVFSGRDENALYRGLTEAMTNCRQHAYPGESKGLIDVRKWWMFSQLHDDRLTVVFCDLGIGIPESLPRNSSRRWLKIIDYLTRNRLPDDDANRIRAAMVVGESRTKKHHRGKGLMDMRSVVDAFKGKLQIHSNRGFYLYDAEGGQETCTNFEQAMSINGTLILWQIPVPELRA